MPVCAFVSTGDDKENNTNPSIRRNIRKPQDRSVDTRAESLMFSVWRIFHSLSRNVERAEEVGFEPTIPLRAYTRLAELTATQPQLYRVSVVASVFKPVLRE